MKKIMIYYIEDLDSLRYLPEGEYIVELENDLDFLNPKSYNYYMENLLGSFFSPINIHGTNIIFNGNNNSISNLYIPLFNKDNVGLFNTLGDSTMVIKNLHISGRIIGKNNIGLLAGVYNGIISNCTIDNSFVQGEDNVGSVVGSSNNSLIIRDCNIKSALDFYKTENFGAVAGKCNYLSLSACKYDCSEEQLVGDCEKLEIYNKKLQRKRIF